MGIKKFVKQYKVAVIAGASVVAIGGATVAVNANMQAQREREYQAFRTELEGVRVELMSHYTQGENMLAQALALFDEGQEFLVPNVTQEQIDEIANYNAEEINLQENHKEELNGKLNDFETQTETIQRLVNMAQWRLDLQNQVNELFTENVLNGYEVDDTPIIVRNVNGGLMNELRELESDTAFGDQIRELANDAHAQQTNIGRAQTAIETANNAKNDENVATAQSYIDNIRNTEIRGEFNERLTEIRDYMAYHYGLAQEARAEQQRQAELQVRQEAQVVQVTQPSGQVANVPASSPQGQQAIAQGAPVQQVAPPVQSTPPTQQVAPPAQSAPPAQQVAPPAQSAPPAQQVAPPTPSAPNREFFGYVVSVPTVWEAWFVDHRIGLETYHVIGNFPTREEAMEAARNAVIANRGFRFGATERFV